MAPACILQVCPTLPTHTFDFGVPGRARLPASGVDQDGWLERSALLTLPAGGQRVLALQIEYPDWSGKTLGELTTTLVQSGVTRKHRLTPALYTRILLPVPASDQIQTVVLQLDSDFALPAPDLRRRAARLVQAELQPSVE